jgi:two-component system NtrC family sensor kinase
MRKFCSEQILSGDLHEQNSAGTQRESLRIADRRGWGNSTASGPYSPFGGNNMSSFSIPCVLLLAGDTSVAQEVREVARRSGLAVSVHAVDRTESFLAELRAGRADLVLAVPDQIPGMRIAELLRHAQSANSSLPVVLIGEPRRSEDATGISQQTAPEGMWVVSWAASVDELPAVMAQALQEHRGGQQRVQLEMDHAADMLRENQKLSTIGRLAASIAHEINNPLEAVTNLLYLIGLEDRLSDSVKHYLALAQRELERVVEISKQTLNFYRETNAPVSVRISDLLDEVMVLYSRKVADKNLRVHREYESTEPVTVYPGEMRQVLSNLVTNAIEACSPNGKLFLRVRSARKWSDSGVRGLRVSIGDNGSGITAETRQKLGQAFFTTKGQHGTGLGLWVTRSIINRYGGELQLRSSTSGHRHGTVFSIFLSTNMRPQAVHADGEMATLETPRRRGGTRQRVSGDGAIR